MKFSFLSCKRTRTTFLMVTVMTVVMGLLLSSCKVLDQTTASIDDLELVSNPAIVTPCIPGKKRAVLPNGEAKVNFDGQLVFTSDAGEKVINRSVTAAGWDGQKLLYYCEEDQCTYGWRDGTSWPLFTWDGKSILHLYGGDNWIIFGCLTQFMTWYCYDYSTGAITEIDCPIREYEAVYIYKDWVISVWGKDNAVTVYNVPTGETKCLDIVRPQPVDRSSLVATASNESVFYLSLLASTGYEWTGSSFEGTYAIDLENWETKRLSEEFYDELYCTKDSLYGRKGSRLEQLQEP